MLRVTCVMVMPTEEEIEAAARVLQATAASKPARVYLFGSYARGEAGPHSDLDFLVVEPEVTQRRREMARLRVALPDLNAPVDVLVCSEEEARFWEASRTHVVGVALAEGRLVAAA